MEAKEKVLATMKEAGTPLNAGKKVPIECLYRVIGFVYGQLFTSSSSIT